MNAYGCKQNSSPLSLSAVHPALLHWFVQSAGLSCIWIPLVHSVCSFACFSVCAFVYVSALFGCYSVCPVLLVFVIINMLYAKVVTVPFYKVNLISIRFKIDI